MRTAMRMAAGFLAAGAAVADEGMWLFNEPPLATLKERHGFEPPPGWLDHLRLSSVRFNTGGSGSFVSSTGLVMTNHHVGADTLQKVSTKDNDYLTKGFLAKTQAEEIKATDLELNVLQAIEDVTARVGAAVPAGLAPADAAKARRAAINTIAKESQEQTGLRSDVVTLYQGGAYHLYRFKKYTDVRVVFAPEKDIAFFGGDPDNFEFPRYDLDVCFFRVYENGQPAKVEHYLKWNADGCKESELVFVSGHPGRTNRLNTVAHLEDARDRTAPAQLDLLRRREVTLKVFGDRSLENGRRAQEDFFGVQNSRKARLGGLAALQDPGFFAAKASAEAALRAFVDGNPDLKAELGGAWDQVVGGIAAQKELGKRFGALERGVAFNSHLFGMARTLVRMNDELKKPNPQRLPEFGDAGLETLREQLFADSPLHDDLETATLADSLGWLAEQLGGGDPLVQKILAGKAPVARAAELVGKTKLKGVAVRKELAAAGPEKLAESDDPMIQLARLVDGAAREVRAQYEAKADEPLRRGYAKIAQARYKMLGKSVYPDATFTLRLAFGVVKGYAEEDGTPRPAMTAMGGAYEHSKNHGEVAPFKLPQRWLDRKGAIKADTPFNFVCTADIIGGNSGSPVVNRAGEVVGLIFDGNIQSLALDYAFTEDRARAMAVHTAALTEALRKVYDAGPLADELGK